MSEREIYKKQIPTLNELKQIYNNKDALRLYDKYWSCTNNPSYDNGILVYTMYYMYTMDFSTAGTIGTYYFNSDGCVKLLIHRF